MKKNFILLGTAILLSLLISACGGDDDDDKKVVDENEFSEVPVETNKAVVEAAGVAALAAGDDMFDEPAVEVSAYFMDLMYYFGGDGTVAGNIMPVAALAEFSANQDMGQFISQLKQEEGDSPVDLFAEKGTYTFNATTNQWDFEPGGTVVLFQFPASATAETNNAMLKISNWEFNADTVPTNIAVELWKENSEIMNFTHEASFSSYGFPLSIASHLMLGNFDFYFNESITNGNTFELEVMFKKDGNEVIGYEVGGTGMFNENMFDNDPKEFLETAHFKILIGDVYVKGEGDVGTVRYKIDSLYNVYDALEYTYDNEKELVEKEIEILNKYVDLSLRFASDNKIIAKGEFYYVEYTYFDETYPDFDIQLVFFDNSTAAAETYFETLIDTFMDNLFNYENQYN